MVQARIKYLDILWHHRWFALVMFTLVLVVVAGFTASQPRIFKADAEIYIVPKPATVVGDSVSLGDYDWRQLNNQVEILNSDSVGRRAEYYVNHCGSKPNPRACADELAKQPLPEDLSGPGLRGSISVRKKDYTNVISISMTGQFEPSQLKDRLALYMKAYEDELAAMNSAKTREERDFLEKQLAASRTEMEQAAEQLRDFESKHQTYNMDLQVNQKLQLAARLDEENKNLSAEMVALQKKVTKSRQHLPTSPEYVNLIARIERDTETTSLRSKIVSLETEKAEWSAKVTDAHPKMAAYNQELARLRAMLDKRLKAVGGTLLQKGDDLSPSSSLETTIASDIINDEIRLESLRARSHTLAAARKEVMVDLQDVPTQNLAYARLKTSYDMASEKVKVQQKRLNEAILNEDVTRNFTRVETLKYPAAGGSPIKPDFQKNMTAAAILGLCWALFSVFIRASLDRTLRWPFQIKGVVRHEDEKAIFTLPVLPSRQAFASMLERSNFTVPEPYKRLIVHLENLSKTDNVRRVGLMPVSPFAECNTTTVALSLYLTELSNKMVLIDTDFTEHSVSALLKSTRLPIAAALAEGPGLSDYLSGETEDFIDIIYPLGKTVYGSFIPSGDPVHDTGFQFSHRNLGQLEENLSPNYNFVLYALPAIEQSYDSIAVGRTLDGVILTVHPSLTSLDQIQHAVRELEAVHCRVLGVLVQPLG